MNSQLKKLGNENINSIANKLRFRFLGIKYGKFQYSPYKVFLLTKFSCPFFKLRGPLFIIFFEWVSTIKTKFKLIVVVVTKTKNSHQIYVQLAQFAKVFCLVLFNSQYGFIDQA